MLFIIVVCNKEMHKISDVDEELKAMKKFWWFYSCYFSI